MATVSSSSSAALQYGLTQLRVQQTKQAAAQAEQLANALQTQASAARQVARQEEDRAHSLDADSAKASAQASNYRQSLSLVQSTAVNAAQLSRVSSNMVVQQASQTQASTAGTPRPVVNTQGQVTGKVVNTTA